MVKMKRIEVVEFLKKLNGLELKGMSKFILFAVDSAKKSLTSTVAEYADKEREIYSPEFVSFETARQTIVRSYAKKNEEGNFVIVDGNFVIEDNVRESFAKDIEKLMQDNKDLVELTNGKMLEFDKFIAEEVELSFVQVSFKHLPENLDSEVYDILSKFVKESPEEISAIA